MLKAKASTSCAAVLAVFAVSSPALPQDAIDTGKLRTVTDVAFPDLHRATNSDDDGTGLRLGTFVVEPQLKVSGVWTSNVNRSTSNAEDDVGVSLTPDINIKSDWSRHELRGRISGEITRYLDTKDADINTLAAEAATRIDIRSDARAEFRGSYNINSTQAGTGDLPGTAIGNRRDVLRAAGASLEYDMGRLLWRGSIDVTEASFGNVALSGGGTEDNTDREFIETSAALRLSYDNDGALSPFVEVNASPRKFKQSTDRNGLRRSSQGYGILAGVSFDNDAIWSGEMALKFDTRNPDDPALASQSILGASGILTWRPTETASLSLSLDSELAETISATQATEQNWFLGLNYQQQLREFVTWNAGVSASLTDTATGTDANYKATTGIDWELNPYLVWSISYEGTWFDGNETPSTDFNEQRILTGIILRR